MKIAYTMARGRGDTDLLLSRLAMKLVARGFRPCGTVQINTERDDRRPCDMDIAVLPDGPILRISQDLGNASKGCRLDPDALETAVSLVERRLDGEADALLINKFGKHEAQGRGFRMAIAKALEAGLPVLVGLNALNLRAFEEFTDGLAEAIPPDESLLLDWLVEAIGEHSRDAGSGTMSRTRATMDTAL